MNLIDRYYNLFANDIGMDLGTANTLVYVRGHGVVINEPSVVAVNQKTGRVVAVGGAAKQMLGRTPGHVTAIRPLVNGVISDFEVTEEMVGYFLKKARALGKYKFARPRVVIGVPLSITNVERRAVRDVAFASGARAVHVIEEPMAAAVGIRLPIFEPVGSMIIDIGGGTTDIAVISLGGIVAGRSIQVAGDKLNADIITYFRDEFKILLGEKTAEDVKIAIGTIDPRRSPLETAVRGRDLVSGLPREVVITDSDIREAIAPSMIVLINSVREVLESTPPEILSDIMHRGIVLVGGGALISGLRDMLEEEIKIPVHVAEDPLTAVVRGTGMVLENIEAYRDILTDNEDELPPR
ncbi:MAG: rod shape-determining protein [Patescibacteria group bacterium]